MHPVLFFPYINDWPKCSCLSKATPRTVTIQTSGLPLQHYSSFNLPVTVNWLINLRNWFRVKKLSQSIAITELMLIGSRQRLVNPNSKVKVTKLNQYTTLCPSEYTLKFIMVQLMYWDCGLRGSLKAETIKFVKIQPYYSVVLLLNDILTAV